MTRRVDVLIAGFGPVGATLAGLLGRRGVDVLVVDRDTEPFALPRAAHIDHTGLRALQELGCLDDVLPAMIPNRGLDFVTAGREVLMRVPGDQRSRSGLPASMYFHQPSLDAAIRATAAALPSVETVLGTAVIAVHERADAVQVAVRRADGTVEDIKATFVVGCDGASSTVREAVGITQESFDFDEQWLVVDLVLPEPVPSLPSHAVHVCDPRRPHTAIPMPGSRYRFELMLLDGDDPAYLQSPAGVTHLLTPWLAPGAARVERAAVYTFHGLVADRWRTPGPGRVLLAGDAAHQMPPFLGQGMCSGLRDAVNLSWKLDAVLRGETKDSLLDTYQSERRPHVRRIVADVVAFGEIICSLDEKEAAARDRRILADPTPTAQRVPFRLPGLEPGPLVLAGGGQPFVQPALPVRNGLRLDDLVGPHFLVLALDGAALQTSGTWWRDRGAMVALIDELDDPAGELAAWFGRSGNRVVVVRPDRQVLGAGAALDELTAPLADLLRPVALPVARSASAGALT